MQLRLLFFLAAGALLVVSGPADARRGADGKYEKRESSHFVLFQDVDIDKTSGLRGTRKFEQEVLKVLEGAYDSLEALLGLRPERAITVIVHDPVVFDQRFGGFFMFPAAGFYGSEIHIRGDVVVHGQLIRTLHHELVHAAFHAEMPSVVLPAWFNEGLAEWFEARATGRRLVGDAQYRYLSAMALEGGLFSIAQLSAPSFGRFGPNAAQLAYLQSYAFFEYLGRTRGERSLRDLVAEFVRIHDLDRAFRKSFRADLADLEADFQAEVLATVGR